MDTYRRDGDVRGVIALLRVNHDFATTSEQEYGSLMSKSYEKRSEHGMAQLVHGRAANR